MVGRCLPVLETSGGRAHLAFCEEKERFQILSGLEAELEIKPPFYLQDGPLDYILENVRHLGVGYRRRGFNDKTMSISAPIMRNHRPMACITMIWIASAMKFEQAIEFYRERLLTCAKSIADELSGYQDRLNIQNQCFAFGTRTTHGHTFVGELFISRLEKVTVIRCSFKHVNNTGAAHASLARTGKVNALSAKRLQHGLVRPDLYGLVAALCYDAEGLTALNSLPGKPLHVNMAFVPSPFARGRDHMVYETLGTAAIEMAAGVGPFQRFGDFKARGSDGVIRVKMDPIAMFALQLFDECRTSLAPHSIVHLKIGAPRGQC